MIDTNKPLELADGTPVIYKYTNSVGEIIVDVPAKPYGRSQYVDRVFRADGTHSFNLLPNLRNVEPDIAVGTSLVSRGRVRKVERIAHGVAIFTSPDNGVLYMIDVATGKDQFERVWTIQPRETTVWQNIYADGSIGKTEHASQEAASDRSKYGKVRVGFLETVRRDGGTVNAKVHSTEPLLRTSSNPSGTNPFA